MLQRLWPTHPLNFVFSYAIYICLAARHESMTCLKPPPITEYARRCFLLGLSWWTLRKRLPHRLSWSWFMIVELTYTPDASCPRERRWSFGASGSVGLISGSFIVYKGLARACFASEYNGSWSVCLGMVERGNWEQIENSIILLDKLSGSLSIISTWLLHMLW